MATKQIYIGSQGPYLYDDSSDIGMSDDQVVTKGDMNLAINLTDDQRATLNGLIGATGVGLLVRTSDDSFIIRSIVGTSGEVTVSNGNGFNGDIQISLPEAITVGSIETDALRLNQIAYAVGLDKDPTHRVPISVDGVTYYMLVQI